MRGLRRLIHMAVAGAALGFTATAAHADITFHFMEVEDDVVMESSGTFDTTGLPMVGPFGWGGTGIEENGNHDIMGGTAFGSIDMSFAFNKGTDFSQWASANGPWTASNFDPVVSSGSKSFTTYVRDPDSGIQIPGLGIVRSDLDGSLWSPDQNWIWENESLASLNMIPGTYSVSDSVTGETITFLIGPIPTPASIGVIGLAFGFSRSRRRRS